MCWLVLVLAGGCDACGCDDDGDDGCGIGGSIGCSGFDTTCHGPWCDEPCFCPNGGTCNADGECNDIVTPPFDPCNEAEVVCGSTCCTNSEVCWFDSCVAPGASCESSSDCAENETCSYDRATATVDTNVCVEPLEGACMPTVGECFDAAVPGCRPRCELDNLAVNASPTAPAMQWGDPAALDAADSVLSPPVMIQLDDDDCNEVVDWRDAPDLLFMTATTGAVAGHGRLVAASVADGVLMEKWSDAPTMSRNDPSSQLASARFDGEAYVVVCTEDDRVRAYDHAGVERWLSEPLIACDAPAVGTLVTSAVVVTEGGILSLATGEVTVPFAVALVGPPVIADVYAVEAGNEIVTPNEVRRADGTVIATTSRPGSFVAVADLDGDATPEMVTVESDSGQSALTVWRIDATGTAVIVRADVSTHGELVDGCLPADPGVDRSGGPPAIADLSGVGTLQVAVAGARGVVVFDGPALTTTSLSDDQTVLLEIPLSDCVDGRRGLSAFDFDHDGVNELVAHDSARVHILSTVTASTVWSACSPSEPGYGIIPIVDTDRDGSAELWAIASARDGGTCDDATHAGLRAFAADGQWAGASRVWRQHADLAPSLHADGGLGDLVAPWTDFVPLGAHTAPSSRQAPDLQVRIVSQCSLVMEVEVENRGLTPVPADAALVRLSGTAQGVTTDIGIVSVPVSLEAGAAVVLRQQIDILPWSDVSATVEYGSGYAVHDCMAPNDTATVDCIQ